MIAEIPELIAMYEDGVYARGEMPSQLLDLAIRYPVAQIMEETPEPWRTRLLTWAREMFDNDVPLGRFIVIGGDGPETRKAMGLMREWLRLQRPPTTWSRRGALGAWSYTLAVGANEDLATALERCATAVLATLDGFARPWRLRVTTAERTERGDEALEIDIPVDAAAIRNVFARGERVIQLEIALDLAVSFGDPPAEHWLGEMGRLWFELRDKLELRLALDTDIYAPITRGEVHDNTELAARNGPRLERCLRAIRDTLGGELDHVEGFAESSKTLSELPEQRPPTTWSRGNALGAWNYTLAVGANDDLVAALERCAARMLAVLDGFARPSILRVTTAERGEDAFVIAPPIDAASIRGVFERGERVIELELELDLALLFGEPPAEHWLAHAGALWLEIHDELELRLSVDTDVYAPSTFGEIRDNAELAARNRPRLERCLRAIQETLGGELDYAEGFADR